MMFTRYLLNVSVICAGEIKFICVFLCRSCLLCLEAQLIRVMTLKQNGLAVHHKEKTRQLALSKTPFSSKAQQSPFCTHLQILASQILQFYFNRINALSPEKLKKMLKFAPFHNTLTPKFTGKSLKPHCTRW